MQPCPSCGTSRRGSRSQTDFNRNVVHTQLVMLANFDDRLKYGVVWWLRPSSPGPTEGFDSSCSQAADVGWLIVICMSKSHES